MKFDEPIQARYRALQGLLNLKPYEVTGIVEHLYSIMGQNCRQGNIGILSDEVICAMLGWDPERGDLIGALVKSGYFLPSEEHRYLFADWHLHAYEYIRTDLKRQGKPFLTIDGPVPARQPGKQKQDSRVKASPSHDMSRHDMTCQPKEREREKEKESPIPEYSLHVDIEAEKRSSSSFSSREEEAEAEPERTPEPEPVTEPTERETTTTNSYTPTYNTEEEEAIAEVIASWNVVAKYGELTPIERRNITSKTAPKLRERVRDADWMASYKEAFGLILHTPKLLGRETSRTRTGYKISFDVAVGDADTVKNILNGKYGTKSADGEHTGAVYRDMGHGVCAWVNEGLGFGTWDGEPEPVTIAF